MIRRRANRRNIYKTRAKKECYEIAPEKGASGTCGDSYYEIMETLRDKGFDVCAIPKTTAFYLAKTVISGKYVVPDSPGSMYLYSFCSKVELQRLKIYTKKLGFAVKEKPIDEGVKQYIIGFLDDME